MTELDPYAEFPRLIATPEDPIPEELWPDLAGVREAEVVTWEPTLASWRKFWGEAPKYPIVSVDTETGDTVEHPGVGGLLPFHGSRVCGVSAAFFDGKKIQAGYWNFRHRGHAPHPWCRAHADELAAVNSAITSVGPQEVKAKMLLLRRMAKCAPCKRGQCPGYVEAQERVPVSELAALAPVFLRRIVGGANFKYDCEMLHVHGVGLPERVIDVLLVNHLWDENSRKYNLAALGDEMGGEGKLGATVEEYMEEHGLDIDKTGHAEVPFSVEKPYAVRDATLVLRRLQFERDRWLGERDPRLMEVFQIETAMTPVFARVEIAGMRVDAAYLARGADALATELASIKAAITRVSGVDFDVLSTDELWKVLEARGHAPVSLTLKDQKPSLTDADLTTYQDPVCELVKAYRNRSKLLSTYFLPLLRFRDANDVVHADFWIHGTVSGRVSCKRPNLENIPRVDEDGEVRPNEISLEQALSVRVEKGQVIRDSDLVVKLCFVPRGSDRSLVTPDESQLEMRMLMLDNYAYEPGMVAKVNEGFDFHEATASEVFPNFPARKADNPKLHKYLRQQAKKVNFGIVYGEGVNKLAAELGLPVDDCVRAVLLVRAARAEGRDCSDATALTDAQLGSVLSDHAVMTASRQWDGLRRLGKDVSLRINAAPLEGFLLRGDEARRERYRHLEFSARAFLDSYHGKIPGIRVLTKGIKAALRSRGYIFNHYGRRYHLDVDRAYVGINRLVQGSSADFIKVTMWRVDRLLRGKKTLMVNQVHDSLPLDLHHSEIHLVEEVRKIMEYLPGPTVRVKVDVEYGHGSWAESRKWAGEEEFRKSLAERLTPA